MVPRPLALVRNGRILRANLRQEMMTIDDLHSRLRLQGIERVAKVKIARLEEDGQVRCHQLPPRARKTRRQERIATPLIVKHFVLETSMNTLQRIRELAYQLWRERGKRDGYAQDDWLEAERRSVGTVAWSDKPTVKRARKREKASASINVPPTVPLDEAENVQRETAKVGSRDFPVAELVGSRAHWWIAPRSCY